MRSKALTASAVPAFRWSFLLPKYWLNWLGIAALSSYQLFPAVFRHWLAQKLGKLYYQKNHKRRHIAEVNVKLCFPQWPEAKQQQFVLEHFIAAVEIMLDMPLLWWAGKKRLQNKIAVQNIEPLLKLHQKGENLILLTCHNLALEYGAIGLNFHLPIVGLVNPFRNPLVDWLISRARTRFNIKLAVKDEGIRAIVKAVKAGQVFYYLPDEDKGRERTIAVNFFGQRKETLPVLAKMARIARARVIPCYSWYDANKQKYIVQCLDELIFTHPQDEAKSTLQMNQTLEKLIMLQPQQYMWTYRLFDTLNPY